MSSTPTDYSVPEDVGDFNLVPNWRNLPLVGNLRGRRASVASIGPAANQAWNTNPAYEEHPLAADELPQTITRVLPRSLPGQLLEQAGALDPNEKELEYNGTENWSGEWCHKRTNERDVGWGERALKFIPYGVTSLLTAGTDPWFKESVEEGKVSTHLYEREETDPVAKQNNLIRKLGFDYKDQEAMRGYILARKHNLIEEEGHYLLLLEGKSAFLVAEHGDLSEEGHITLMQTWNQKTGASYDSGKTLLVARSYAKLLDTILTEEKNGEIDRSSDSMYVIFLGDHTLRVYPQNALQNPNGEGLSISRGRSVSIKDNVWKKVDLINNKNNNDEIEKAPKTHKPFEKKDLDYDDPKRTSSQDDDGVRPAVGTDDDLTSSAPLSNPIDLNNGYVAPGSSIWGSDSDNE